MLELFTGRVQVASTPVPHTVPGTQWTLNKHLSNGHALDYSDPGVVGKENSTETTLECIFQMTFLFLQQYKQFPGLSFSKILLLFPH